MVGPSQLIYRDSLASTSVPAQVFLTPVELRNSDQARGIEHGVVDDDAGSLVGGEPAEVELLRLDIPAHAGVLRIWNRVVPLGHR